MNYYEARERSDHAGWAWTRMNDGVVWTSGGCVTWPEGEDKPGPPHAHSTKEEAERCFYDWETAHLRTTTWTSASRCQYPECGLWTDKTLGARLLGDVHLCDQHLTPAAWQLVRPLEPDLQITASW